MSWRLILVLPVIGCFSPTDLALLLQVCDLLSLGCPPWQPPCPPWRKPFPLITASLKSGKLTVCEMWHLILICDQSYISNVLIFLDIHLSKGRWMEGGAISIPRMMSRISLCVKEATFTLFFLPWLSQVHGHHRPTLVVWSYKHCPKSPQLWVSDKWFASHLQIVCVVCCLDSSRYTAITTSGILALAGVIICNQPKQCTITIMGI